MLGNRRGEGRMSGDVAEGATEEDLLFLSWLAENGATFPKLRWPVYSWPGQPHDGERGVLVTEDIAPGERMFSVPGGILLNREKCLASDIGGIFRQHRAELFSERDELALSLLIMYEKLDKGVESFWWPMIQALPKDPGSAALWGDAELSLLQDDALRAEALLKPRIIADTHKRVILPIVQAHPEEFTAARYTIQEFQWALLCVESRTFGRFLPHPSITPFADLLNHVNVHTSYRWDPASGNAIYSCDASGKFPHTKGSEAFMSYGPRTNRELLLHYGFTLDSNVHDTCSLQFRVSKCVGTKKTVRTLQVELRHERPCLPALALFRKLNGSVLVRRSQAPQVVSGESTTAPMYIDKLQEKRALEWLRGTYQQVLDNSFGSSLDADMQMLALQSDHRKRFAVLYCIGRKKLLMSQICFVEAALKRLDAMRGVTGGPEEGGRELVDCAYLAGAFEDVVQDGSMVGMCDMLLSDARALRKEQSPVLEISEIVEVALPESTEAADVVCGPDFTAVVGKQGELFTYGSNRMAKLGHSRTEFDISPHIMLPERVMGLVNQTVTAVGCGADHVAALTRDGEVWCWGANTSGQCGLNHKCTQVLRPTKVEGAFSATTVACGEEFNVVTSEDGTSYAWGRNHEGQCGVGKTTGASGSIHAPAPVQVSVELVRVFAFGREACGITKEGSLWCWGCAMGGRLGLGSVDDMPADADGEPHASSPAPASFEKSPNCGVASACIGPRGILLLDAEGCIFYAGGCPIGGGHSEDEGCESFRSLAAPPGASPLQLILWKGSLAASNREGSVAVVHADGAVSVAGSVNAEGLPHWKALECEGKISRMASGRAHQVLLRQGSVLAIGSAESGEAGVQLGLGCVSVLLQERVSKGLVNVGLGSHPGVVCCVCKCETIKGVRYMSVSSHNVDVCGACINSVSGSHLMAQHALLVCHRRLPKNLRPSLPFIKLRSDDESASHDMPCAACASSIQGRRFMCGNCADYSLCKACHDSPTRGGHASGHLFVLLGSPIDNAALPKHACLPNLFPQLAADVFQ